jgi:hypothetical protein
VHQHQHCHGKNVWRMGLTFRHPGKNMCPMGRDPGMTLMASGAGMHYGNEDPINGSQIGTQCPIVHAR